MQRRRWTLRCGYESSGCWLQQTLIWRNSARVLWCSFEPSCVSTSLSGAVESSGVLRRQNHRRGDESSGVAMSSLSTVTTSFCSAVPTVTIPSTATSPLLRQRAICCADEPLVASRQAMAGATTRLQARRQQALSCGNGDKPLCGGGARLLMQ